MKSVKFSLKLEQSVKKKYIYRACWKGGGGGLAVEIYMRENPCKPTRKMRTLSKNSN